MIQSEYAKDPNRLRLIFIIAIALCSTSMKSGIVTAKEVKHKSGSTSLSILSVKSWIKKNLPATHPLRVAIEFEEDKLEVTDFIRSIPRWVRMVEVDQS